jgi:hypothetical protein
VAADVAPQGPSLTAAAASAVADTPLDAECAQAVAALRQRCPQAFRGEPLRPGQLAAPVPLGPKQARRLFRAAFGTAPAFVWTSGEDELLVRAASVALLIRDGFVLVSVPVFTDQTGDAEVVVPFAVGRADAPVGLIMATEPVPRGPSVVVERWGSELVAACWQALVRVAGAVAAAAGVDVDHQPLLPVSLQATPDGLVVLPQARHAFDRVDP